MAPATRISPPLNRPFNHRSSLPPASKNFLFLGNPTPSSTIVAVRCQVPFSEGGSSTNHASSVSSSIDFLTLCHRLKVCVRRNHIDSQNPKLRSFNFGVALLLCRQRREKDGSIRGSMELNRLLITCTVCL